MKFSMPMNVSCGLCGCATTVVVKVIPAYTGLIVNEESMFQELRAQGWRIREVGERTRCGTCAGSVNPPETFAHVADSIVEQLRELVERLPRLARPLARALTHRIRRRP